MSLLFFKYYEAESVHTFFPVQDLYTWDTRKNYSFKL